MQQKIGPCPRARLLAQLDAATRMSDALLDLYADAIRPRVLNGQPVVVIPVGETLTLYKAWADWLKVAPEAAEWGDDEGLRIG